MAEAVDFPEANDILRCPPTMENCKDLSIHRGNDAKYPIVISCWEFSDEEVEKIVKTRKCHLIAWGCTHPPVLVHGNLEFTNTDEKMEIVNTEN